MRITERCLIVARVLALATLLPPVTATAQQKTFVAFSMKQAEARIRQAISRGEDFRKARPELLYLGGITRPWAVVLDPQGRDWLLVGERDPRCSVLTLDDWVAAVRARFLHGERDPGMSIDPRPCAACRAAGKDRGCFHSGQQDVRYFAGVEGTHFGQVCFEADWLLKRIDFGLDRPPIKQFQTGYDLRVEESHRTPLRGLRISTRLWFLPVVDRVGVYPEVVLLERFQMGVFHEVEYVEIDGQVVAEPDNFPNPPVEQFVRSFTEKYDHLAQWRPVLETLRGLTRLSALAKGLAQAESLPPVDYFLASYPPAEVKTPKEVEVLQVENREAGFTLSGGVDLLALVVQFQKGDARALRDLVLAARRAAGPTALIWDVEVAFRDGYPVDVTVPDGLAHPSQIAPLFSQATFLLRKNRPDAAIEYYDRILQLDPQCGDAWSDRGFAHRLLGKLDVAEQDYRRALKTSPKAARACNNLGVLLMRKANLAEAEEMFRKGVKTAPFLPSIHNNLAICLRHKGDLKGAAKEYQAAIALNRNDPDPCHNLGLCLLLDGKVHEAVDTLKQAAELRPESRESCFWYAVALFEDGKNDLAREAFQGYLRLAEYPMQNNQPWFASYQFATVASSFLSDDAVGEELGVDMKPATAREYLRLIEAQRR